MIGARKRQFRPPVASRGFSMVELMVALAIGLFILAVLANVFMTTRTTGVLQQELSRVQEAGRFATEFLAHDIRMAGYAGCRANLRQGTITGGNCDPNTVCTIVGDQTNIPSFFDPGGIRGHAYVGTGGNSPTADWEPDLPATFFPATGTMPRPFTDVIVIQRASSLGTHLTGNPVPDNANIQVFSTADLAGQLNTAGGDVLMVSDCKSADVFMSQSFAPASGTITHPASRNTQPQLTHSYGNDAELFKMVNRAYYVRNNAAGVPALFRRELTSDSTGAPFVADQELAEGVEFMLVAYGVDADDDKVAEKYLRADGVTDFAQVISARVGLLVRTPGTVEMTTDTTAYNLGDDSGDGSFAIPAALVADQNRRQVFTMMVQRRN